MKKTLKQIFKTLPAGEDAYFFWTDLEYPYPDPENTANFIDDYQANAGKYNLYAVMKRGNQTLDLDEELMEMLEVENPALYMFALAGAITDTHLEAWARLYYALSLAYNPLYNVDGTTIKTISERERTDAYGAQSGGQTIGAISASDIHGAKSKSDVWGAKSATLGEHTDTQTNYSVSFDAATEKETGKTSNLMGAQTNTENTYTDGHTEQSYTDSHTEQARTDSHQEAAHTDKHTDAEYTETEERKGNIGVTMSQQLLNAEWELRKKDFFATIINQMLDELGFMYVGGIEA